MAETVHMVSSDVQMGQHYYCHTKYLQLNF